jgi:hypothetical protein
MPAPPHAHIWQVLLLIGYLCLLDARNQSMLTWGGNTSHLLHRITALPPAYTQHPLLAQVRALH